MRITLKTRTSRTVFIENPLLPNIILNNPRKFCITLENYVLH